MEAEGSSSMLILMSSGQSDGCQKIGFERFGAGNKVYCPQQKFDRNATRNNQLYIVLYVIVNAKKAKHE